MVFTLADVVAVIACINISAFGVFPMVLQTLVSQAIVVINI
jgi:hypothetical protein